MFDIAFSNEVGMEIFFEMVFNLLIAIMESGYSIFCYKFFDYWIKICKIIPKKLCEIIFRLIFAVGILVILIIFKEGFNLGKNPFDYFSIILEVFGMLEIYTNVGFFMLQLILD